MLTRFKAIIFLFIAGVISWLIALTYMPLDKMEMGAILNLFGPPIVFAASVLVFYIIDFIKRDIRLYNVIILCLINIAIGIYIRNWSLHQIV